MNEQRSSTLVWLTKANKVLGWKTQFSLEDALASAWEWEKTLQK